jgi:hypothetical protein
MEMRKINPYKCGRRKYLFHSAHGRLSPINISVLSIEEGDDFLPFFRKGKKYHVNHVNPWPRPGNAHRIVMNKF